MYMYLNFLNFETQHTPSRPTTNTNGGPVRRFYMRRVFPPKLRSRRLVCYGENVRRVASFVLC